MGSTDHVRISTAQAESLTARSDPWLSCDDCFEQIDSYVEGLTLGDARLDEPLRVHMARCPACFEEAESLITLVAADDELDADDLIRSFRADVAAADQQSSD